MILGGAGGVLFLLLSHQEIAHAGFYTFLGVLLFCIGLIIRHNALKLKRNKKKTKRIGYHSWIMNERDDE